MFKNFKKPAVSFLAIALALPMATSVFAQEQSVAQPEITVTGQTPSDIADLPNGPDIKGIISARKGDRISVSTGEGQRTAIAISDATKIKNAAFLGGRDADRSALLNGLPVTVKTKQWNGTLIASQVSFKKNDLKLASMINNGTDQRFGQNEQATEALRGRVGDIDNYIIKATTNVNFDTGKTQLSEDAKASLCQAATQAETTNNALLLVVGYTDSVGSQEFNQTLSEKRAASVINYLQQACHWKPYRVLTPTGMAMADPVADNTTPQGKAQNRRVAVNIVVSKAVDGFDTPNGG